MFGFLSVWKRKSAARHGRRATFQPKVEALEERIALSWSGVPPTSIRPPAGVGVTLNSFGDATGNAAISRNEVDYYRFTAPTTGSYRIAASTPNSNLDTVLGVFNSRGQRIAYNDDISYDTGNYDSEVTITLQAGLRYYFGVTNYTRTPGGTYTWVVDGPIAGTPPVDDGYEENDTRATAADLGSLSSAQTFSNLRMWDREDWFQFTQSGYGGAVSISFTHAEGDLDLYVYDAAGTLVGQSESVTNSEQVLLSGLGAGTYSVEVYAYSGVSANYALTIDPGTDAEPPPPPAGNFEITLHLTGFTVSQQAIFQQAADRWEQIIIGDLPDVGAIDDILIEGSSVYIDGRYGILGQAGPDALRSGTGSTRYLPYRGSMEFDSADVGAMSSTQLFSVIVHEMGHVLGVGTIWDLKGLITGEGGSNPRFTGAQAVAAYRQIFNSSETSIPVENTGGAGTRDGHWRESVFDNEIMTGWIDSGANPISRVTVASMADLGYVVNMNAADSYVRPGSSSSVQSSSTGGSGSSVRAAAKQSSKQVDRPDWITAVAESLSRKDPDWAGDAFFAGYRG